MAGAAPAYRYEHQERRRYGSSPDFRVLRGGTPRTRGASEVNIVSLAKLAVVLVLAITLVAFVRVGLVAGTVSSSISIDQTSEQMSALRSSARDLEVQYSMVSNPTTIKREAEALGMKPAADIITLTLPEDVVQTNDRGELSLSKSLAVAASQL